MPHGLPLPFFYILDVLYFGQRRSALCLSVDHTNQSLMPRSQENKCIFLLQHLADASQRSPRKSLFIYHRAAARNQPFWELLRSCLPSRSPVIFLVYSWAQWRRKPSLYAPLQHCTSWLQGPLPKHRLASSVRNLHSFCLFGHVSITNHVYFFPIPFLPCSKQPISGRALSILKMRLRS